jgi:hypothetical protein
VLSIVKIRQAGFHDCIGTAAMLDGWLEELQGRYILPR